MILCTECYIQQDGRTLMLHRNKKQDDINQDKWTGLGGKFEVGESPEQCLIREVQEEAGVTPMNYRLRGIVTFMTADTLDKPLYIFIYTASDYRGEIDFEGCAEGTLQWINTNDILDLNLWEGDRLFWSWMQDSEQFFSARFVYDGEKLAEYDVAFH